MADRIEFRFTGDYDEKEFTECSAYWVRDTAELRERVQTALSLMIKAMKMFGPHVYCIGERFMFEDKMVHVLYERA